MTFSWTVAIRFLKEGRAQSLLIITGATVGVAVMVFLTALINGLQADLIAKTLGTQSQVVVSVPQREVRPPAGSDQDNSVGKLEKPAQRLQTIQSWPELLEAIRQTPGVVAATASVSGGAFALRGEATRSIVLKGVEPSSYDAVIPLANRVVQGNFRVDGNEAVLGFELAKELGLTVGDKVRLQTVGDRSGTFTVAGLVDVKNQEANLRWVFVSLRAGQTLLDLGGGPSAIDVKVKDVFQAETVAGQIRRQTGLEAKSWLVTNQNLMVALRSQSSSSSMIQFFVVLAVALGIASVLVVSVVQKSKEVGILKAMGTRSSQIVRIFLIQGFLVGFLGAVLGAGLGGAMAILFQKAAAGADGGPPFALDLSAAVFVRAMVVAMITGVLAGIMPARRAARLDPAVVIRYG